MRLTEWIAEQGHSLAVLEPAESTDLCEAAPQSRPQIERLLAERGAVLLRGFRLDGVEAFEACAGSLSEQLIDYRDRATRRSRVAGHVYTATDTGPRFAIGLHSEGSFAATWPRRLFFHCAQPSESGGRTPIADTRRVYDAVDPDVRRSFEERGLLYVRNFRPGPGMGWRETFQVETREELERVCGDAGVELEWVGEEHLRTRQRRPAVAVHPGTGERVWFNHAAVLHISGVSPALRDVLRRQFDDADLPHNALFGDGTPIDDDVLDRVRAAYATAELRFDWQPGDVLVLDNLLMAHGREPFRGAREVHVAIADPMSWSQVTAFPPS